MKLRLALCGLKTAVGCCGVVEAPQRLLSPGTILGARVARPQSPILRDRKLSLARDERVVHQSIRREAVAL